MATCILQLQRGVIFISNHAGKLSAITRDCLNRQWRFRGRPENRVANFVSRVIPGKATEISHYELSSIRNLVAGGTSGLADEKIPACRRIAGHGVGGGLALQKTDICDDRVSIFFAETGERRHARFQNSVVNQVEQFLVGERLGVTPVGNIRCVLTAQPVKTMASRALRLETALSSEARGGLCTIRILAINSAARAQRNQSQTKLENDSPSHVTSPGSGASEAASLRKSRCIPLRENNFLGIGDIRR